VRTGARLLKAIEALKYVKAHSADTLDVHKRFRKLSCELAKSRLVSRTRQYCSQDLDPLG